MEYTASFAKQLHWKVVSSTALVQIKIINTNQNFTVAILWSSKHMTFAFCSIWNQYRSTTTYRTRLIL